MPSAVKMASNIPIHVLFPVLELGPTKVIPARIAPMIPQPIIPQPIEQHAWVNWLEKGRSGPQMLDPGHVQLRLRSSTIREGYDTGNSDIATPQKNYIVRVGQKAEHYQARIAILGQQKSGRGYSFWKEEDGEWNSAIFKGTTSCFAAWSGREDIKSWNDYQESKKVKLKDHQKSTRYCWNWRGGGKRARSIR